MQLAEIHSNTDELFKVLAHCAEQKYRLCTSILVYSGIDMIAALTRPKQQLDTDGPTFKKWSGKYLLGRLQTGLTAEDLWGARCGVLHTNQPESRTSRQGNARMLQYIQAEEDFIRHCQGEIDPQMTKVIFLDIRSLTEAFKEAVVEFLGDVERDPDLRDRVSFHADKVFGRSEYQIPK